MKPIKKMTFRFLNSYLIAVFFMFSSLQGWSQAYNFIVSDTWVSVQNQAAVHVPGHLVNENNGSIKLDGKICVGSDVVNNAANNMFLDQQTIPIGQLIMRSYQNNQQIRGLGNRIFFPNLHVIGNKKTLYLNDCQVNNKFFVESEFDLNRQNFIINNKNTDGIHYISGFIRSESHPPQYGTIQWNIQNNTGSFSIPFGSGMGLTNDLNLTIITETSGSADGFYKTATYPAEDFTNNPYPQMVMSLAPYQDINMVDRFWFVEPSYVARPNISLAFKYNPNDYDTPNRVRENTLEAIRHNDSQQKWNDWKPGGIVNPQTKTVQTNSIPRQHQYSHWALVSEDVSGDIWIPNAFSPDRDEYFTNEDYGPVITFPYAKYEFYIFNRWGEPIFESHDINMKWDGTYKGEVVPQGTYVWLIIITKHSTKRYKYNGIVNVIL